MCILLFFEKYRRESRKKIKRDSGVVKFVHVTDKVPLIRNNESWQRSWGGQRQLGTNELGTASQLATPPSLRSSEMGQNTQKRRRRANICILL